MLLKNRQRGFTLIELLVVIGVLAVLLAIVLIAINPQRQFNQANDTKRRSDVNAILNAVSQFAAENRGTLPAGIPVAPAAAGTIGGGAGQVNICLDIVPDYIAELPVDPQNGTDGTTAGDPANEADCAGAYNTGYTIQQTADGRVSVNGTASDGTTITVTR
jgi:type IV pilus assembly protein PilA